MSLMKIITQLPIDFEDLYYDIARPFRRATRALVGPIRLKLFPKSLHSCEGCGAVAEWSYVPLATQVTGAIIVSREVADVTTFLRLTMKKVSLKPLLLIPPTHLSKINRKENEHSAAITKGVYCLVRNIGMIAGGG